MKAMKILSLALLIILLVVLGIGVFLPSRAHVERDISIIAPQATVFALLNDLNQQQKWSPWVESDPTARFTRSGPRRGVGATIEWDGKIIGRGSQRINESMPFTRIVSSVDLGDSSPAIATFLLDSDGVTTMVRWTLDMDFGRDLAARYFGLLSDKLVGRDYEKGLQNLKSMAESLPQADFGKLEIAELLVESITIAYLPTASVPQSAAISEAMGKSFFRILTFIDKNDLQAAGPPMSITRSFSGAELRFDVAIPIIDSDLGQIEDDSGVQLGTTYAGPALRARHIGPYRQLSATHARIAAYIAALGIERNGDAWESYVSDPTQTNESELLTYVYYPVSAIVQDQAQAGDQN